MVIFAMCEDAEKVNCASFVDEPPGVVPCKSENPNNTGHERQKCSVPAGVAMEHDVLPGKHGFEEGFAVFVETVGAVRGVPYVPA